MNTSAEAKFRLIEDCIARAKQEYALHVKGLEIDPYWYSGHKNKAWRALQMAQELIQEVKNDVTGRGKE